MHVNNGLIAESETTIIINAVNNAPTIQLPTMIDEMVLEDQEYYIENIDPFNQQCDTRVLSP